MRTLADIVSIVSIQTDQSRRVWVKSRSGKPYWSFNRINPNRSIPTWTRSRSGKAYWNHSFNRINPNRSIPTATLAEPVVARLSDAEWRNLFLKD